VRLDIAEERALERVRDRAPGRHLTDDVAASRVVWRAFYTSVAPSRRVDLVVDTAKESPASAGRAIQRACDIAGS
jgi:hypothetical protein